MKKEKSKSLLLLDNDYEISQHCNLLVLVTNLILESLVKGLSQENILFIDWVN